MQGDFGGLARSAYKCVSLARLRSCTGVHSRRLASQSRISAERVMARLMRARRFRMGLRGWRINAFRSRGFGHVREYTPVALLHKAAFLRATSQASTARRSPRGRFREKTRYLGLSRCPKYRVFLILHSDIFCGLRRVRSEFFRLGSFLCSYEYMKIRVRLMRTEEDVNENEEHFVHVGARLALLPRGGVVGAFILSVLCVGRAVLSSCAGVYVYCFAFVLW